jgi:hypothetical protein
MDNKAKIKEIIRAKLKEMSATGAGAEAAHFEPGEGNVAPAAKYAYNPNKKAKGAQNIYYYKLGWKPVPVEKLHKASKTIDHKDLWKKKLEEKESTDSFINSLNLQDGDLKSFITDRINDYDEIEKKLNELVFLLKQAKAKTEKTYKEKPDFNTAKELPGTEFGKKQLDDMIKNANNLLTLFNKK